MFPERSVHKLKAFQGEEVDYSYICPKITFSSNSGVIDIVQVRGLERLEDFPKHMPNRIMSATLLKGSSLHPRPNHPKDFFFSPSSCKIQLIFCMVWPAVKREPFDKVADNNPVWHVFWKVFQPF